MVECTGDQVLDEIILDYDDIGAKTAGCFRGYVGNCPGLFVLDTSHWCYFYPAEPGREEGAYDLMGVRPWEQLPESNFYDIVIPRPHPRWVAACS